MNALYRNELRLFQNLFLLSVKLVQKVRMGSRVRRVYDRPQTPLERVEACPEAHPSKVAQLRALQARLDPLQLAHVIDHKLERLYALAHHRSTPKINAPNTDLTPAEKQTAQAISQRFGIPVDVGKPALARATRK